LAPKRAPPRRSHRGENPCYGKPSLLAHPAAPRSFLSLSTARIPSMRAAVPGVCGWLCTETLQCPHGRTPYSTHLKLLVILLLSHGNGPLTRLQTGITRRQKSGNAMDSHSSPSFPLRVTQKLNQRCAGLRKHSDVSNCLLALFSSLLMLQGST
jgi:hypothetical protein